MFPGSQLGRVSSSTEFSRLYDAVLGRLPHYNEFMTDLASIGLPQTEAELQAARSQFAAALTQRAEFGSNYSGLANAANAEAFVSKLEQTAGARLASHAQFVAEMGSGRRSAGDTVRALSRARRWTAGSSSAGS